MLHSKSTLVLLAPVPILALSFHFCVSARGSYKIVKKDWEGHTQQLLDAIIRERSASSDPSAFRVDREALVDALDKADRAGIGYSNALRREVVKELATSLTTEPDPDDRDGVVAEDDMVYNAERVVRQHPEVLQFLSKDYKRCLAATVYQRKRDRRWALFRYLVSQSGSKIAVYSTVVVVSALRAHYNVQSMLAASPVTDIGYQGFTLESLSLLGGVLANDARLLCFDAVCEGLLTRLAQAVTEHYRNQRKAHFYRQLLSMDISYFDLHTASDIDAVSYFIHDLEGVDVQLHFHLMKVVSTISKIASLTKMDRRCAAALLGFGLLNALVIQRFLKICSRSMQSSAVQRSCIGSEDQGGETVSGYYGFVSHAEEVINHMRSFRALSVDRSLLSGLGKSQSSALHAFTAGGNLWKLGAYHISHETIMITTRWASRATQTLHMYLATSMLHSSAPVVRTFVDTATDIVAHVLSMHDIVDLVDTNAHKAHTLLKIFDYEPKIESATKGSRRIPEGDISLVNVSFAYPSRVDRLVFRDVSCTIPAGKLTVLRGPNGCGKSTLAFLLSRLYDPCSGRVLVGGVPLTEIHTPTWREHIGYVPQMPILLPGTIEFNIKCGRSATATEVEAAAVLAGAHEFIRSLPEGYLTRLGPKHTKLSGGQQQRIALARAYLRNPRLIILDEPSSALDEASQEHLVDTLKRILVRERNVTVVCITHSDVFIRAADHAVVMKAA